MLASGDVANPEGVGQGAPSTLGTRAGERVNSRPRRMAVSVKNGRIAVHAGADNPLTVLVTGADGRVVRTMRSGVLTGWVSVGGPRLARGIYCIDIRGEGVRHSERLVIDR